MRTVPHTEGEKMGEAKEREHNTQGQQKNSQCAAKFITRIRMIEKSIGAFPPSLTFFSLHFISFLEIVQEAVLLSLLSLLSFSPSLSLSLPPPLLHHYQDKRITQSSLPSMWLPDWVLVTVFDWSFPFLPLFFPTPCPALSTTSTSRVTSSARMNTVWVSLPPSPRTMLPLLARSSLISWKASIFSNPVEPSPPPFTAFRLRTWHSSVRAWSRSIRMWWKKLTLFRVSGAMIGIVVLTSIVSMF